ncbi:MAG: Hsp33 family molecular chaperone HslO [Myxococcota bacterium]|nr:Hsp33 family molecular chaperone HslO [Myxococcota bacterium]
MGGDRELYRGLAEVNHAGLQEALQAYLETSQQSPGLVRLGASTRADGSVDFAAGLLVEMIPETMEVEEFEGLVESLRSADLRGVMTQFAFGELLGQEIEILEVRDLVFKCRCSRARVEATLQALGDEEIRSLMDDPGYAEVTCHFCNASYRLELSDLEGLLA